MQPHLTPALAYIIEQNDIEYTVARLDGMRQAEGNPLRIAIQRFGGATAFLIEAWPEFWYGNRVLGLNPGSRDHLDEIMQFFASRQLDFRIELIPGDLDSELAGRLHRYGFSQMGFSTAMYGLPGKIQASSITRDIDVRLVQPNEIESFIDLYQTAFGDPALSQIEVQAVRAWLERESANLHLCMALIGGQPVAVAVLYTKNGLCLLADAATLPEFRGRGCHWAMIQHRMAEAARRHCELVTSFVAFGSPSHHNLERAGLRVAYTKALWWKVK